eukprot:EC121704.1.p1 GENE.EC121704.1~~EC121704.1.p1  ORF type:complete len:111 (+),score=7.60 EC121704.1:173-505(+)
MGDKLVYFNARGRAEVSRMLFIVAGVEFEDYRFDRENWPTLKTQFTYGQVPILEVDGVRVAQSQAIERFLARRLGLRGLSDIDAPLIEGDAEEVIDIAQALHESHSGRRG